MDYINDSKELIRFIESSPSMFHSVKTIREMLEEDGFTYLPEGSAWKIEKGGRYYAVRNHSSIIAFKVGSNLGNY